MKTFFSVSVRFFDTRAIKIALVIPFFLLAGCADVSKTEEISTEKSVENPFAGVTAKLFRSPNCGCCTGHAAAMEAAGMEVEVISDDSKLNEKKVEHGIAMNLQSCHTIEMAGYFVEGHVPLEAMAKLVREKPEIDGIALPGMPIGTPGMPGEKVEPFKIKQIKNGEVSDFLTI